MARLPSVQSVLSSIVTGWQGIIKTLIAAGWTVAEMLGYISDRTGASTATANSVLTITLSAIDAGELLTSGGTLTRGMIPRNADICDYAALGGDCAYTAVVQVCLTDSSGEDQWQTTLMHFASINDLNDLESELEDMVESGELSDPQRKSKPEVTNLSQLCGYFVSAVYRRT